MLAPSPSDKFIENPEPCSSVQVIGSFAMLIFFWFFICFLLWQCSQLSPPPNLLLDRLVILLLAKMIAAKVKLLMVLPFLTSFILLCYRTTRHCVTILFVGLITWMVGGREDYAKCQIRGLPPVYLGASH